MLSLSKRQIKKLKKKELKKQLKMANKQPEEKLVTEYSGKYRDGEVDGCAIVLLHKTDETVFVLLRLCNDIYYVPKGHRKIGETMEQGAKRELTKYTGIKEDQYTIVGNPILYKYQPYYHNAGWKTRGHYVDKNMYFYIAFTLLKNICI